MLHVPALGPIPGVRSGGRGSPDRSPSATSTLSRSATSTKASSATPPLRRRFTVGRSKGTQSWSWNLRSSRHARGVRHANADVAVRQRCASGWRPISLPPRAQSAAAIARGLSRSRRPGAVVSASAKLSAATLNDGIALPWLWYHPTRPSFPPVRRGIPAGSWSRRHRHARTPARTTRREVLAERGRPSRLQTASATHQALTRPGNEAEWQLRLETRSDPRSPTSPAAPARSSLHPALPRRPRRRSLDR